MIVQDLIDQIEGVLILLSAKPHPKAIESLKKHSAFALQAMLDDLVDEFERKNPGKKVLTLS